MFGVCDQSVKLQGVVELVVAVIFDGEVGEVDGNRGLESLPVFWDFELHVGSCVAAEW